MYWKGSLEVRIPEWHLKSRWQAAGVLLRKYSFQSCLQNKRDKLCPQKLFNHVWQNNNFIYM